MEGGGAVSSEKQNTESNATSSYTYWVREAKVDDAPLRVPRKLTAKDVSFDRWDNKVENVDRTMQAREQVVQMLKCQLKRAQVRMQSQANKYWITERQFDVGDWVYLKLQPHRQVTVRQGQQRKLSAKYHGPFMLKKCKGSDHQMGSLPLLREDALLSFKPQATLERRLEKLNNKGVMYVLVQWANRTQLKKLLGKFMQI
ncbi:hypothetical protein Tco_0715258 [Tanacetum coccineum]